MACNDESENRDISQHHQLSEAEIIRLWETCKDYSTALQLNRDFLRGRQSCTPYHMGSLDPETTGLLDDLQRLHDFGFLTTGSQPSQHDEPFLLLIRLFLPLRTVYQAFFTYSSRWSESFMARWVRMSRKPKMIQQPIQHSILIGFDQRTETD